MSVRSQSSGVMVKYEWCAAIDLTVSSAVCTIEERIRGMIHVRYNTTSRIVGEVHAKCKMPRDGRRMDSLITANLVLHCVRIHVHRVYHIALFSWRMGIKLPDETLTAPINMISLGVMCLSPIRYL
jgi:hypothetical protein